MSTPLRRDRVDWSEAPMVLLPVYRPSCPGCGAQIYEHVRGEANGDGSSTERVLCRGCGQPYLIVREPALPGLGNCEQDIG